MRRLVAALIAVSVAFALAGCGGGGDAEEAATTTPQTPVVSAGTSSTPVTELPDRSAPESATVFEPFPKGSSVPTAVVERIEDKQPTLILFINGRQKVTNEVRSAVDTALKENVGVVDLVVFDLGKYTGNDQNGQALADANAIHKDDNAERAAVLARDLKVSGLPYIIMTDDQGFIVFRWRGLVDADFLLMHMERLTD